MSTRSTSSNLFFPLRDPKSLIRRRNLGEPSSLFDFEETMSIPHNNQGPPPVGPPPHNNNGPPPVVRPNGPALDLRLMEELCQLSINGQGRPIARIQIQATDFGLREPSSLFDFEETMSIPHNNQGPPPVGPPPQNNNGPPPVKLSLPDLTPTRMTLELATKSIANPAGIAKDVFVQSLDSDSNLPEESSESSNIATLSSSPFGNKDKETDTQETDQNKAKKRQNQTQSGKDQKRQSKSKPEVKSQRPWLTKVNPRKVKVNPGKADAEK
nr:hypothetical protein [Tanacetum cinerariifolium]